MRLALIGDIHSYRLRVNPLDLFNKRLLGQVNLWLNRRRRFRPELLPPVWARVAELRPEALLFTGDVSTCALREEFADVAAMLRPLIQPDLGKPAIPAVMVAGNHDRYVPVAARERLMERELGAWMPPSYPHFQRLAGRWRLLALDSAFPQPLWAEGRVGAAQLEEARRLVAGMADGDSLVVMCHYPAVDNPAGIHEGPRHGLQDIEALRDFLRDLRRLRGPTLYLHGHVHRPWLHRTALPGLAHIVDVNAGAPSNRVREYPRGQGFWEIELPEGDGEVVLRHHHRIDGRDEGVRWGAREHRV